MYNLQLYKLYYKIQREAVPHYFNTVIHIPTYHHNTRQGTQHYRNVHTFVDHFCDDCSD